MERKRVKFSADTQRDWHGERRRTALYAALHFLVDGVCAAAMAARFAQGPDGILQILWYNFCAFALQLPFGTILDALLGGRRGLRTCYGFALLGSVLTVAGAFVSPVLLGIGNGLFHVGGGVSSILEDRRSQKKGRLLGVFVAPGAMGLYLGRLAAGGTLSGPLWMTGSLALMAALLVLLWREVHSAEPCGEAGSAGLSDEREGAERAPQNMLPANETAGEDPLAGAGILLGCLLVVVLRSFVGMVAAMPWKTGAAMDVLAVSAVVLGKAVGGFAAARFGRGSTVCVTLLLSAVCFAFSDRVFWGLPALFFFNMTMPVTLQILADRFPRLPGTMFGLLTLGLFLGFLPTYFSMPVPFAGSVSGTLGSLMSLPVLWAVARMEQKGPGTAHGTHGGARKQENRKRKAERNEQKEESGWPR